MKPLTAGPQDTETASHRIRERLSELADQRWSRHKSRTLAQREDIDLHDEHWAVIVFLRRYYLEHGLPIHARMTARALSENFSRQGSNKYLHRLFAGGPVTQGCRIANLRTPAYATDPSFGTSY
jgi:tRNA 2-thiouridine synthesizing protein E